MRVAVVGGGIAGLATAYFLREKAEVTVLEGGPRLGGKLRTIEVAGVPLDAGAEAMLNRRPEAVALARETGLDADLRYPTTTSAGLWVGDEVHPIPAETVMGLPGDLSALADAKVLTDDGLERVRRDLELDDKGLDHDVSIGTYARERLGDELVDRVLEPLLGGVYAGQADGLSLRATVPQLAGLLRDDGSLIRAVARAKAAAPAADVPVFAGLDGGVGRLPEVVAHASGATIRTNAMVRELRRTSNGWRLTFGAPAEVRGALRSEFRGVNVGPTRDAESVDVDAVVLACPARPASRLLAAEVPEAAGELATIEYASMATIAFAFPRRDPLEGSGVLVPPVEHRLVKAVTYSSNKWGWLTDRAPELQFVRCSVGRLGESAVLQRPDEELVAGALTDLRAFTGIDAEPVDVRVTRWGGGLPQYAVGHRDLVERTRAAVAGRPGLALAGAAYDGVGIPACIATAKAASEQLLQDVG